MSSYDLYLISPYLAVAGTGLLVVLLDLVFRRKGLLAGVALAGLALGLLLTAVQARDSLGLGGGSGLPNLAIGPGLLAASLAVDRFALFFNVLVLAAAGIVILASVDYLERMRGNHGEFLALLLFSATGMMLLSAAAELITIYIALELTTLPLAALAALLMDRNSSEAGLKYLIVGAISSALMLYGMALLFGFAGTTSVEGIAAALLAPAQQPVPFGSYAVLAAVALLLAGFGFKIAAVPFQMWVPDVYQGAPAPVAAFLSVASKAAGFAVLLRVFYTGFGDFDWHWGALAAGLAAASMTVGNLVAMSQTNIRRLLGYSTIAHAGYILIGVAAVAGTSASQASPGSLTTAGPSSVLFYLAAYVAANLTAFVAVIAISSRIASDRISDYAGLVQRSPFLAAALALALAALIGIPPTSLFIAKLYVFSAAVHSGLAWLALVGVINSVVSAYYYIKVIRVMFLEPPAAQERIHISPTVWAALALVVAATLWMGIAPAAMLGVAEGAVRALSGVAR
ncbi:MAG: NADH-quinone oxidoreductase subunit N [SAR202 cluster bacterium]|nr:NADH-quinone oxidoreductase subunit N [SAR202 cluster bacterium]